MTEPATIVMLKPGDELHVCPSCGYALGFHTSFLNANAGRDNPVKSTREVFRVILICPECGARFDVGWRVSFAESASKFVKTPVGSVSSPHPSPPKALQVTPIAALPPTPSSHHDEPPPS